MEDIAMHLRGVIKEREGELRKAATYGTQLLQERQELKFKVEDMQSKLEALEQEKHSLQTELKIQIQINESHSTELEAERQQVDNLYKKLQMLQKENENLHQRIQNMTKENQDFKKSQDELLCEVSSLKAQVITQEEQIKVYKDQPGMSMSESTLDVTLQMQNELDSHILKIKTLENELSQVQHELEGAKIKESQLNKSVEELKQDVIDKNAEIKSYFLEVKRAKEEVADLQAEIEVLKFEQMDINRHGNSVFSELDDRRKFVEKEYKILDKKYQQIVKLYEQNRKEVDRARGQLAILSSMTSWDYQQRYIEKLEEDNLAFREEIRSLTVKLSKLVKTEQETLHSNKLSFKNDEYDYLRALLQQSEEKVKSLKSEVANLHMQNASSKDKLLEVKHHLYQVNQDLEDTKKSNRMLKLKIEEMKSNHNVTQLDSDSLSSKPNVEILPGNEAYTERMKTQQMTVTTFNKDDVIPAELELGEDGFHMKKPSRKSNIFVLRELNHIPTDESEEQNVENISRTKPFVSETDKKLEAKKLNSVYKTCPSNRNLQNDRCAQQ